MPSILTSWARSFVVALSLLALCAPAWAEPKPPAKLDSKAVEPQVFRYKYYAGTKQTYDNKIVQESRVEAKGAPGQVPEGALVTTIDTTFTNTAIKVLPSGEGTFERTTDKIAVSLTQGKQAIPSERLQPQLDAVKKIKRSYKTTPEGERSQQKVENLPPGAQQALDNPIQDLLIDGLAAFPSQPMKIGDQWKRKLPVEIKQGPMSLKFSVVVDSTFLGYTQEGSRRLAVFKAEVFLLLVDQKTEMPGHKVDVQGSGKGGGYFYFDQKEGSLVRSEVEFNQSLTTSIGAGEQGQSLGVQTKATILLTLQGAK
jgi:hypothetical protein